MIIIFTKADLSGSAQTKDIQNIDATDLDSPGLQTLLCSSLSIYLNNDMMKILKDRKSGNQNYLIPFHRLGDLIHDHGSK